MKESVDDVLAHYGVKGMRWGVRRKSTDSSPSEVQVNTKGKKIKTKGGTGLPANQDALKTAIGRQKAKKSGVQALSNQELQDAVRRMQLEQQFKSLNYQQKNVGARFVASLLGNTGKQVASETVKNETSQRVKASLAKKAVKAAVV